MEPTSLVYVTMIISGITLVSPEPVSVEQCKALQDTRTTVMCIDKEADCGKASGNPPCLGRSWDEQPKPVRVARRRHR